MPCRIVDRSGAWSVAVGRGIIMESFFPSAAQTSVVDRHSEIPPEVALGADTESSEGVDTPPPSTVVLGRLMDLADRYARQLVATAHAPSGVLLLACGSDLDVVTLDGPDADVRALPQLLAQRKPTSAGFVGTNGSRLTEPTPRLVLVVGETSDGYRDERRFRLRPCGRSRRLTRLPDPIPGEAPSIVPRLFPEWVLPHARSPI